LNQLVADVRHSFPRATDDTMPLSAMPPRCGLRPATPEETPPVLGATAIANLFVNGGQGALGWTPALASARVVSATIVGRKTKASLDGFTVGFAR
jgi:D-amino-acid dehydrogenase